MAYKVQIINSRNYYIKPANVATTDNFTAGLRSYELKDHLGNVRVVVADKLNVEPDGKKSPDVKAVYQYYAFGSPMPSRYGMGNLVGNGGYRYGFNGKEKDDNLTSKQGLFTIMASVFTMPVLLSS